MRIYYNNMCVLHTQVYLSRQVCDLLQTCNNRIAVWKRLGYKS